jgi:hypothetical protein
MVILLAGVNYGSWAVILAGLLIAGPMAAIFYNRVRKAHFNWLNTIISPVGLPIFVLLLVRSQLHYKRNQVSWKGRQYAAGDQLATAASKHTASIP